MTTVIYINVKKQLGNNKIQSKIIINVLTNNNTLPFNLDKCAQGWCEVSLIVEKEEETEF